MKKQSIRPVRETLSEVNRSYDQRNLPSLPIRSASFSNGVKYATFLALSTAAISGFSNFTNKFALLAFQDPVLFVTLKNTFVAVFLVGLILAFKKWREAVNLGKSGWLKLLTIGAVGGALPFALYFTALSHIPAVNAALIHKTLVLWVLIFALPFLKERLTFLQGLGIAAVFAANFLIGGFAGFQFNRWELVTLMATVLWGAESIIAKKALSDVSSELLAAGRMVFGSIFLFGYLVLSGANFSTLGNLSQSQWGWTILTSALLVGYVLTWYKALKHAPAIYVATLLVPATLVTNILAAIFVTHSFNWQMLGSAGLFLAGIILIIKFTRNFSFYSSPKSERMAESQVR